MLDDPTQGIDIGARAQIHDVIGRCAADGIAILLVSTDSDELADLCDRILILAGGRCARVLQRGLHVTAKLIVSASSKQSRNLPSLRWLPVPKEKHEHHDRDAGQAAWHSGPAQALQVAGLPPVQRRLPWIFFIILFGTLQFHLFLTVSTFQVVFSAVARSPWFSRWRSWFCSPPTPMTCRSAR